MRSLPSFVVLVLVVSCSGGSSSTPKPNLPPGSDPNSDVKPPITEVPPEAGEPPLAKLDFDCTTTKTDGMCNQARPKALSVVVNHVNGCNISVAKQLTVVVDSSASPKDSIRIQLDNYNGTANYNVGTPNTIEVWDNGSDNALNGAAPHGAGSECNKNCTVNVTETSPNNVRRLALDVRCAELCVPNACLRCKTKGQNDVHFGLALGCP